jgi:hypothetical protein
VAASSGDDAVAQNLVLESSVGMILWLLGGNHPVWVSKIIKLMANKA